MPRATRIQDGPSVRGGDREKGEVVWAHGNSLVNLIDQ